MTPPADAASGPSPDGAQPDLVEHEVLVLGAGPGGLQLAYFLERAGTDYLVLEAGDAVGTFFRTLPRRRELISFNKVHSVYDDPEVRLRWDWNSLLTEDYSLPFREFSEDLYPHADDLVRYLEAFARQGGLKVRTGCHVERIARREDGRADGAPEGFELTAADGTRLRCRVLVIATGFAQPYVPDIPGIEHAEGYESAPVDEEAYRDQRVLILGKGNSALELADVALARAALIHVASPTPVQLAWKTRHPGHVRAQHTRLLDMYQLKTLNGALDCHVTGITPTDDGRFAVGVSYVHADGETEELVYDRVLRCTGFRLDTAPFAPGCVPETILDGRLPATTGMWESVNVPDLFFAGTLMQGHDYKRSSSAFIDGFRYNVRTLAHWLRHRYEGAALPVRTLDGTAEALRRHVVERVCRTSSLWTQFGSLCDLFVVDEASGEVQVHEDQPLRHVGETTGELPHCYTLVFDWGRWDGDAFHVDRHPRHDEAHTNVFLHPILRRFRRGEKVAEHHVLEDLFGTYSAATEPGVVRRRGGRDMEAYHREEHDEPLQRFFEEQLGGSP